MVPLSINMENNKGVTVLSNVFVDKYMKDANDAQLKVYLYLLRMVGANLPTDISEIADIFNHTEKDVIRSLKYWEAADVLSLSYDEDGNITGVSLKNLNRESTAATKATTRIATTDIPTKQNIPMISMDYNKEKASYSLDDLARLSDTPDAQMILNAASMYFGRPLNPNEIRTIVFIFDRLAFSFDLTDYLIDYCVDNNQANIQYIEQVAINWYEEGIDTVSKAKQTTKNVTKSSYQIMKFLGKSGEPTGPELEYIRRWTSVYAFSLSIIEDACQRTVLATDKNRFQYADSILKNWYSKGVRTKKDIAALDDAYVASKSTSTVKKTASSSGNGGNASFCRMESQGYDFEALEKALTK